MTTSPQPHTHSGRGDGGRTLRNLKEIGFADGTTQSTAGGGGGTDLLSDVGYESGDYLHVGASHLGIDSTTTNTSYSGSLGSNQDKPGWPREVWDTEGPATTLYVSMSALLFNQTGGETVFARVLSQDSGGLSGTEISTTGSTQVVEHGGRVAVPEEDFRFAIQMRVSSGTGVIRGPHVHFWVQIP